MVVMATKFARFNLQLKDGPDMEGYAEQWQEFLDSAAIEGFADEHEVFFLSSQGIVGVSVPYEDDDPLILLEAGGVLGYCRRRVEESDIGGSKNSTWFSLHDSDDSIIDSLI
jgi:hypothetical protein